MACGLLVQRIGGLLWRGPVASSNRCCEDCEDRMGYCMHSKFLMGLSVVVWCARADVSALVLVVVLRG